MAVIARAVLAFACCVLALRGAGGAKVCLVGASGGIGQPLALLLKQNDLVGELALCDLLPTAGLAADLSHINTRAKVWGHADGGNEENRREALEGADIVVITAGVARKPGMSRDDLFGINAGILASIAADCAECCPGAHFCIVSNPVNALVPLFAEVLRRRGAYDKRRVYGVTTLDEVRAATFVAESQGWAPETTRVPVVGGHSGKTIVPLLSRVPRAAWGGAAAPRDAVVQRVQFGGDEVVEAKAGAGSATLSMAHSAAVFVDGLLRAAAQREAVRLTAFIESDVGGALARENGLGDVAVPFFASEAAVGPDGVEGVPPLGEIDEEERQMLLTMLPALSEAEAKGVAFARAAGGSVS